MRHFLLQFLLCIGILPTAGAQSYSRFFRLAGQDTVNFTFTLKNPDIKALDSYPQQITRISKNGENYEIALTTINPYLDGTKLARMQEAPYAPSQAYDREIAKYLQSTGLIDARNEYVRQIADTLFKGDTHTFVIIEKALKFVYGYLSPSDSIAKQIDAGNCRTVDVNTVIQTRKGTCSEYTNLFASLMRHMHIPTRFAVGYFSIPEQQVESTHAWPECYIEGAGWCAVDPTFPSYICPHFAAIRMRYGLDFEDCDISTLKEDIEPIAFTKEKSL